MKIKTSVFIAASLDGYIAREDGGIDWLSSDKDDPNSDYGYNEFISSVDVIIMGRNTFEIVLSFDAWYYGSLKVFVLSSREWDLPDKYKDKVEIITLAPEELLSKLESEGYKHAYIDGGKTIQGFLGKNLIDEITLTRVPVILGSGIPLFGVLPEDVKLEHIKTVSYDNGLVQSKYRVNK